MARTSISESRVVVALEAGERDAWALELARWLTPSRTLEMLGLFVENESLLEHARSRQAREILRTGAQRALSRSALERQIRAEAARAKALFEAASARLGLPHRFETTRGDVLLEPIRHAVGAQALVVTMTQARIMSAAHRGFYTELCTTGPPLVLLARQGWLHGRTVAVLLDGADDTLLDAAARVAQHSNSPVAVLVPRADPPAQGHDNASIAEKLRARGIAKLSIIPIQVPTVDDVVRTARACNARILVMHPPADEKASATVEQLSRRFSGALMLVRS